MDATPIGLGTMQLTGSRVWGPPHDWAAAVELLRLAYDWGVRVFDTAWYYGPHVTHRLLVEALHPYPEDLLLITKAGNSRREDKSFRPALTPSALRAACELDLQLLRLEALPLALLRWQPQAGDEQRFAEALHVMLEMQAAGTILQLGLSNVASRHVALAEKVTSIAAISNSYSLQSQRDSDVLSWCTRQGVTFLPYYPLLGGELLRTAVIERVARKAGASPAQVALAWLRHRSPIIVPIPGTRSYEHLKENIGACALTLAPDQLIELETLAEGFKC